MFTVTCSVHAATAVGVCHSLCLWSLGNKWSTLPQPLNPPFSWLASQNWNVFRNIFLIFLGCEPGAALTFPGAVSLILQSLFTKWQVWHISDSVTPRQAVCGENQQQTQLLFRFFSFSAFYRFSSRFSPGPLRPKSAGLYGPKAKTVSVRSICFAAFFLFTFLASQTAAASPWLCPNKTQRLELDSGFCFCY